MQRPGDRRFIACLKNPRTKPGWVLSPGLPHSTVHSAAKTELYSTEIYCTFSSVLMRRHDVFVKDFQLV